MVGAVPACQCGKSRHGDEMFTLQSSTGNLASPIYRDIASNANEYRLRASPTSVRRVLFTSVVHVHGTRRGLKNKILNVPLPKHLVDQHDMSHPTDPTE